MENGVYYFRMRSETPEAASLWAEGHFRVSLIEEEPESVEIVNPAPAAKILELRPSFVMRMKVQ